MNLKLSAVLISFACVACGKTEAPADKKPAAPASEKKAAAPATVAAPVVAKKTWLKIDKFGVQIEVPEGATAADGAGTSLMISAADGSCTVMLSKKDDMSYFQSYDATVAEIEKGTMGKKKEMLKNEKVEPFTTKEEGCSIKRVKTGEKENASGRERGEGRRNREGRGN